MTTRVRCVLVGDEPLVAQCAEVVGELGLDVVLLATTNPIVGDFGVEHGVPVVGQGAELSAGLATHRADVLLSVANEQAIPDEALALVNTAIHLHDGPLPGYAGLNVTTWAILNGESEHAITWHLLPSGAVVDAETFPIAEDETAFSLNARCYEATLSSLPRVVAALTSSGVTASPRPTGTGSTFTARDRPALLFDPTAPAADSARAVRALDLGHRAHNSVGSVRWVLGDDVVVVEAAHRAGQSTAPPGTLLAVDQGVARIATADGELVVTSVVTLEGMAADIGAVLTRHGAVVGDALPSPKADLVAAIRELEPELAEHEPFWLNRLVKIEPTAPAISTMAGGSRERRSIELPPGTDESAAFTAIIVWLARTTSAATVAVAVNDPTSRTAAARVAPLTRPGLACLDIAAASTFADVCQAATVELGDVRAGGLLLRDAPLRDPRVRGHHSTAAPVLVELDSVGASSGALDSVVLRIALSSDALVLDALTDPADPGSLDRAAEQISTLLSAGMGNPSAAIADLPLVGPAESALLDAVNRTDLEHDRSATVDALFHARAARSPDAPALSSGHRTLTYRELEDAVGALAGRLAAAGVKRGDRVGIAVPRSVDMVVGVLATLDLGAAYLPLDPTYPADRLSFMVEDAGIVALLATGATAGELSRADVVTIDPAGVADDGGGGRTTIEHDSADLAYLIYTSGSTGLPKGVMLEHRQVTNFFEAMDQVIERDPPGVWLAVTSLSFDISVLELLWTLTRGFHVVLKSDRGIPMSAPTVPAARSGVGVARPVTFSLFYFAAGEQAAADGYRLLLDSARFADRNGFEAVWTPERHFHAFGGAYPNPSVTGAALAAITEHVGIRAGSVVLPLHSPIRVAEEWAVVDNLSRGRVAISFAAGWQPNDFVLNPAAFATAKDDLARNIAIVEQLWRGEKVTMPGHDGQPVEVATLPRPMQSALPVWLTSAGSPATFERAGKLGVNVLTHLLGQSVDQLAANIERYRAAWRESGHAGEGRVTLMMHTYLDRDAESAREIAREPMKSYLRTAVGLLRDFASAFPIFAKAGKDSDDLFKSLTDDELDQLLEMAAQRYLRSSGLFGTPDEVAAMVEQVSGAGVDEVACLIDFGIETDDVMASLDRLLEAKAQVEQRRAETTAPPPAGEPLETPDDSVAALTARHGVTHLQCTPSLAAMLVADPADRAALGTIDHLMLGGEALPSALAAELRELLPGRFTNMYGPTETTIWSLVHELDGPPGSSIPIGRPIANTTIFVLDPGGSRLPLGAFGELHLGGEGVARGYHNRQELTAERFVDRPGMGRVYATGDIVRLHPDGLVEFAGRADNQVKIRGHRVELGEIEAVIDQHPDVVQSVVVARDDRGDTRLVAYVIVHGGTVVSSDTLRKHVAETLPDAMVPSAVVRLDAFPLTPNGKIDRKALPAEAGQLSADAQVVTAPPVDDTEQLVAGIWVEALERPVGRDDNFFDIGGHSLVAVKVFRRLTEATGAPLALTDVFRFPTVRTFAAHLTVLKAGASDDGAVARAASPTGTDRGARRRQALTRRGGSAGSPG